MPDIAFQDYRQQMFDLYNRGRYADALTLVEREGGRFPEERAVNTYWQVCLRTLTHDQKTALKLFREALDAGFWFPITFLRSDPDLKSLQGNPEFERMVGLCTERRNAARDTARHKPFRLTVEPPNTASPLPLLMALHGNTGTAEGHLENWRPVLEKGWLLALPQSSQAWGAGFIWDDQEWTDDELCGHFTSLAGQYLLDPARIVLGGFSMGGETAARLALTHKIPARGFIAVAPGGPLISDPGRWSAILDATDTHGNGIRGYAIVGGQDARAVAGVQVLAGLMRERGLMCEVEVHSEIGHVYPPGFVQSLDRAFDFLLED